MSKKSFGVLTSTFYVDRHRMLKIFFFCLLAEDLPLKIFKGFVKLWVIITFKIFNLKKK